MNFNFRNETERLMYEKYGGGQQGEEVVNKWREYLEGFAKQMREYGREMNRDRFYPRSEKETVTHNTVEDDYD